MEKSNLRTLDPDWPWPKRKTKLINPRGSCKINVSSSWYIGCLGEKIPLGLLTKKTTKMFFFRRMSKKKPTSRPYFIKVRVGLVSWWSANYDLKLVQSSLFI